MKYFVTITVLLALAFPAFAREKSQPKDQKAKPAAAGNVELKDQTAKASYAIGLNIGQNLGKQKLPINADAFNAGFKDGMAGTPKMTEAEIKETMTALEKDMENRQKGAAEKNKQEGEKFLAENKNKPGIKTTASGLQYKVIREGTGAQPKPTDTVTVNYEGKLIDGTVFDSSYKRGQPATFPLNAVIRGWTEGLQLMKVGGKYQLFVPADLAYGDRPMGPDITPNSTLIFDIELLDAKPAATASPSASPSPNK